MENGFHVLPDDLEGRVRFGSKRGEHAILALREKRIGWIRGAAQTLRRRLNYIREKLGPREPKTGAKLDIPLPAKLLSIHGMGGRAWPKQFSERIPLVGDLAEPGG